MNREEKKSSDRVKRFYAMSSKRINSEGEPRKRLSPIYLNLEKRKE